MPQDNLLAMANSVATFLEVNGTFYKMEGFKTLKTAFDTKSYKRKYIDNYFESCDVAQQTSNIIYIFDRLYGNKVHDFLADIFELGKTGKDCKVNIITADLSKQEQQGFFAVKREYSVCYSDRCCENDFLQYRGEICPIRQVSVGYITSDDGFKTATFHKKRGGIL